MHQDDPLYQEYELEMNRMQMKIDSLEGRANSITEVSIYINIAITNLCFVIIELFGFWTLISLIAIECFTPIFLIIVVKRFKSKYVKTMMDYNVKLIERYKYLEDKEIIAE